MKLIEEASDEALLELFAPKVSGDLTCPFGEHVLRLLAAEYLRRGLGPSPEVERAFVGPARCPHGRSTSGFCGACDVDIVEEDPCPPIIRLVENGGARGDRGGEGQG